MRKTEIKVGTAYAVYPKPVRAGTYQWRLQTPVQATVVSLGDSRVVESRTCKMDDGTTYTKDIIESGIVVKLAEPQTANRHSLYSPHGGWRGNPQPHPDSVTRKVKVDTWVLESGACVRDTWADYQEDLAFAKASEQQAATQQDERRERVVAEAQKHAARLNAFLDRMEAAGYTVEITRWQEDHPNRVEAVYPNYNTTPDTARVYREGEQRLEIDLRFDGIVTTEAKGLFLLGPKLTLPLSSPIFNLILGGELS